MNYQLLKEYLTNKVLKIETEDDQKKITGLQEEFCTANNLTESEELTQVLTRFYHSIINTTTSNDQYYLLPAYEQLVNNHFASNQPNLGVKSNDGIETAISEEHYQLLDQIIVDFQASLPKKEDQPETPVPSQAVTDLNNKALAINTRMAELVSLANPPNTNDQTKYMQILKGILLKSAQGKKVLADIKQWLTDYQQLTDSEKQQLADKFSALEQIDKIKVDIDEEEEPTTEKPSKDDKHNIKDKEGFLYLAGFIIVVGILVLMFDKRK
ncbi:MAG: hypothetical protein GBAus27B_000591 [Mycoplasmataceae bacterium]|nr:MAG: hypothetical protein GBAus27B_000591 [Mycoplasmataceae bacterium]